MDTRARCPPCMGRTTTPALTETQQRGLYPKTGEAQGCIPPATPIVSTSPRDRKNPFGELCQCHRKTQKQLPGVFQQCRAQCRTDDRSCQGPHLGKLSPGGEICFLLHPDEHDVDPALGVGHEGVLTGVFAVVQDLSLTVEMEQGVRRDPIFSLFPSQSTSDMQDVAGATRATSTLPSVLIGSPSVSCGLSTFQEALTPGADEFQSHSYPSSSCWRRREHGNQRRVRWFDPN